MIPGIDVEDAKHFDFEGISVPGLPRALLAVPHDDIHHLYHVSLKYPENANSGKEVLEKLDYKILSHEECFDMPETIEENLKKKSEEDEDLGTLIMKEADIPLKLPLDYKLKIAVTMYVLGAESSQYEEE